MILNSIKNLFQYDTLVFFARNCDQGRRLLYGGYGVLQTRAFSGMEIPYPEIARKVKNLCSNRGLATRALIFF